MSAPAAGSSAAAATTLLSPATPSLPVASSPLPLDILAPRVRRPHPIFGHGWAQLVASVNVHNTVKIALDIKGTQLSLWRRAINQLVAQWDVGAHLVADFNDHDDDLEWRIINISVKGWLLGTMSLELQGLLMNSDSSAFSVWTAIDTLFLNNKRARQVYMLADLYDQKQLQSSASVYVAKIKRCADGLRDAGKSLSDDELVVALLKGLSDRHKMTAKLIRRSSPPCDFDTAVSMLLMDELEDGSVGSSSDTALAVYKPPSTPVAGAGSPFPNQGKPKRKRTTNHGGYGNSTPAPPPAAPWTGYVHAYPVRLPPPPRHPGGPGVPGLLGSPQQAHTAFVPVQYTSTPTPYSSFPHMQQQLPYQHMQQQLPYQHMQQLSYQHMQQLPYQQHHALPPPPQHQQQSQQGVHESGVDQAALMGALQNLTLQNSSNGWVADSGATSHMTSDHGLHHQGGAAPMQQ